ncbi:hypothetical protein M2650_04080 [Luteimonas sp. SX5]|uniref:Uncharacterized protein n=1 Tax=Luteimonas galliterrae TaxID=2940486 RepID=A0ABT0MG26_9GAMM|nr:hypothetical protein [Luteimonas galliterrae]MCL1633822.1 hypothetical protein [Luteimonas galliterrae]
MDGEFVEWRQAIGSFFCDAMRAVGTVLAVHLWLALNVMLAINPLLALIYAVFPPVLLFAAMDDLAKFTTFSLWAAGVYFFSLSAICIFFGRRLLAAPAIAYFFYLPFFAVWLPLFSGEIVRAAAMHAALIVAGPECYETSSLMASLHDRGEHAQSHAWMVKNGDRYLWSYREFRFVADSRPESSGGVCR